MRLAIGGLTLALLLAAPLWAASNKEPAPPPGVHLKIRPEKIHYRPGEELVCQGSVFNNTSAPVELRLRVWLTAELTDTREIGQQALSVAAGQTGNFTVRHTLGGTEYGHELRLDAHDGQRDLPPVFDWFSVADNLWKVGIGAPGGGPIANSAPYTEAQIVGQIERIRASYCNWFEKQFWAPDDWGMLTPAPGSTWYSGQAARHENEANLRRQIAEGHKHGIKAISYGKAMAGGQHGWELARRRPQWFMTNTQGQTFGRPCTPWDLENWQRDKPGQEKLNPYVDFSCDWTYRWVDLRRLDALDHGIDQMIASTKQFGWDGFRFDTSGFAAYHSDGKRRGHDLVNTRNMKRLKERIWAAFPGFLLGHNTNNPASKDGREYPLSPDDPLAREIREMLAGGALWMGEALREEPMRNGSVKYRTWSQFARDEVRCIRTIKHHGGHFVYSYGIDGKGGKKAQDLYKFALGTLMGAHQYVGDHTKLTGYADWGPFLTRWSGFFWDHRLKPWSDVERQVEVGAARELWWKEFANVRVVAPDRAFLILNLVNPPLDDQIAKIEDALPPPAEGAQVSLRLPAGQTLKQAFFIVPDKPNRAVPLTAKNGQGSLEYRLPAFAVWGMLVCEVSGKFEVPVPPPPFTPPFTAEEQQEIERVMAAPQVPIADRLPNPTPVPVAEAAPANGGEAKPVKVPAKVPPPAALPLGGSPGLDVLVVVGHYHRLYDLPAIVRTAVPDARVNYCEWTIQEKGKGHQQVIPATYEELFAHDLLVLVNVDSRALGNERMQRMAHYVRAGGGLVLMGGPMTLGQGGYADSPLAEVLPVTLRPARDVYQLPRPLDLGVEKGKAFGNGAKLYFFHAVEPRADARVGMWAGEVPVLFARNVERGRTVVFSGTMLGEPTQPDEKPFWESAEWKAAFARAIAKP